MAGVRKARAAETEAALKAAAKAVFAERGYLNTKITDITAAAGRAAGSFYNHFAGKDELLEALLADLLADVDDRVQADPAHDPDFSSRAAVRYHVAAYFAFFRANSTVMVALQQAAIVDEKIAAKLDALTTPDVGHLAEHLEYVRRAGRPLPGDPAAVARAISAMLVGFAHAHLVDRSTGDLTDEAAVDLVTDLVHRGLGGVPDQGASPAK